MEKEFCAALKCPLARLALDLKSSRPKGLVLQLVDLVVVHGMRLEVLVVVLASS